MLRCAVCAQGADAWARRAQADTLLVVGGLYGNLEALASIEAMAEEESRSGAAVTVVFNGCC